MQPLVIDQGQPLPKKLRKNENRTETYKKALDNISPILSIILENKQLIPNNFCTIRNKKRYLGNGLTGRMFGYTTRKRVLQISLENDTHPIIAHFDKRTSYYTVEEYLNYAQYHKFAITDIWRWKMFLERLIPLTFTDPKKIKDAIFSIHTNMEVQQALIERYGIDNILKEPGIEIIDRDDSKEQVLFKPHINLGIGRIESVQYLKVKDSSTPRHYLLAVPSVDHDFCCGSRFLVDENKVHYYIDSCLKAVAWTYYCKDIDYKPISEA